MLHNPKKGPSQLDWDSTIPKRAHPRWIGITASQLDWDNTACRLTCPNLLLTKSPLIPTSSPRGPRPRDPEQQQRRRSRHLRWQPPCSRPSPFAHRRIYRIQDAKSWICLPIDVPTASGPGEIFSVCVCVHRSGLFCVGSGSICVCFVLFWCWIWGSRRRSSFLLFSGVLSYPASELCCNGKTNLP